MHRLLKHRAECVYVCKCVCIWRDAVKGQSSSRPVQIHTYPVRPWHVYGSVVWIVPDDVEFVGSTPEHPGDRVWPKLYARVQQLQAFLFPLNIRIRDANYGWRAFQPDFPVTALTQTLVTENLPIHLKSVRVIWVLLGFHRVRDRPVRQTQTIVGRVWVERELTGVCSNTKRIINLIIVS